MFKIFLESDVTKLEKDMNSWIDDNPGIEVVSWNQSESYFKDDRLLSVTVIVYYKTT